MRAALRMRSWWFIAGVDVGLGLVLFGARRGRRRALAEEAGRG